MTHLDTIIIIGNVLTELDVAIGSLLPSNPQHQQLLDLRMLLDDFQRMLAKQVFDENSEAFQAAADELAAVNREIQGTIRDIDRLTTTIQNITRLLGAVASLLGTARTLAAVGASGV